MADVEKKKVTQSLLVSDKELELLKSVFAENDELLETIRDLFFGLEITNDQKDSITSIFKNDDLKKLFIRRFLPEIRKGVPVGQSVDLWTGVEVIGKNPIEIVQVVTARAKLIEMVKVSLALLDNPNGSVVDLNFVPRIMGVGTDSDLQVELISRNQFISHVETQLIMIKVISGQKVESVEQAKQRLTNNSNK